MDFIDELCIDSKDIVKSILPPSNNVNYRVFSSLLDDNKMSATYKMYWLLGILDEAALGNREIEFRKLISRMITYAWYPIRQFRLNFGVFDNLKKAVDFTADLYGFKNNCDADKLLDTIYNSENKELNKMIKDLGGMVPFRLLSPYFNGKFRGLNKTQTHLKIVELSAVDTTCLYKIIKDDNSKIIIHEGWMDYLQQNYKVIKYWIYYKLVAFMQKRNPNVPGIAFKLEAPKSRDLTKATKLWKDIIVAKNINDIYTGKEFTEDNYKVNGVLSIDHFIPWSFVLHDQMWNLVPTFKNVNSSKSDNLLKYDNYIDKFCESQYKAFSYICDNKINNDLESYMDALRIDNPYEFYKYKGEEDFNIKLKECLSPIYQIAVNQGFQIIEKL